MCRIAAYLGPPLALQRFLLDPPHSLYRQSWQARETMHAAVNADGFGLAWYHQDQPALYRQPMPVWTDSNLPALARSLSSGFWLGNVRSATDGLGVQLQNTQPFADERWVFAHNGKLGRFARDWRPRLRRLLTEEIEAGIHGNTDSEYLFGLLRQLRGKTGATVADALRAGLAQLHAWHAENQAEALLNIVLSDGTCLAACRHALGSACPSLYYCTQHPRFPHAVLIASEPFDREGDWHEIPPHHSLRLQPGQRAELLSL